MVWPDLTSRLGGSDAADFSHGAVWRLAQAFATTNPHLHLTVALPDRTFTWTPTRPDFQKWSPSNLTSPHWYEVDDLSALIAAYLQVDRTAGRERTVRDLIAEFRGLRSTAKLRAVAETAGLHGARLVDLIGADGIDQGAVGRLLTSMQQASRAVDPKLLGILGDDHIKRRLVQDWLIGEASFRYARSATFISDGVPLLIECGFGVIERGDAARRSIVAGVNWSASAGRYPQSTFADLDLLLAQVNLHPDDPAVLFVHAALPTARYDDRGKSRLALDLGTPLREVVSKVTRDWTRAKKAQVRASAAAVDRASTRRPEKAVTILSACFEVMEQAYLMASAGGSLPVKPRQIMYSARPMVLARIGKFYAAGTQQFEQEALVKYLEQHPVETASWRIDWDARGSFREPHSAVRLGLGTRAVEQYVTGWGAPATGGLDGQVAALLAGLTRVPTRGPAGRTPAWSVSKKKASTVSSTPSGSAIGSTPGS